MSNDAKVDKIIGELRASIRKARASAAPAATHGPSDEAPPATSERPINDAGVAADFASLHYGYDIVRAPFYSHRRLASRGIIAVKNFAKELLMQVLVRQVSYNAANARVVTHLGREIESLKRELNDTRTQTAKVTTALRAELQTLAHQLSHHLEQRLKKEKQANFDSGYLQFEHRYRGSEADIAERQRPYLACFAGQADVLDIGCGRGEFLGLLQGAGIPCRGVDTNPEMVAHCRRKCLEVVCGDCIEYVEELPDESLGGVFCAQMIEHLEPNRVIGLVQLCHRKLEPGGVLVIETPNPECLMVFAESFYKDFTHIRPFHPAGAQFLLKATGFEDVETRFGSPVDSSLKLSKLGEGTQFDDFNRGIERLNQLIYGSQDYAVIGIKQRSPLLRPTV